MSDAYQTIIDEFLKDLAEHQKATRELQDTINRLCKKAGREPMFPTLEESPGAASVAIRSDQFHGRPMATVVREYLEMRKATGQGPATVNEIHESLVLGGYEFAAKSDQIARISLSNTIRKNPVFYRLPNGRWGLFEWYPNARRHKRGKEGEGEEEMTEQEDSSESRNESPGD